MQCWRRLWLVNDWTGQWLAGFLLPSWLQISFEFLTAGCPSKGPPPLLSMERQLASLRLTSQQPGSATAQVQRVEVPGLPVPVTSLTNPMLDRSKLEGLTGAQLCAGTGALHLPWQGRTLCSVVSRPWPHLQLHLLAE
jgi:hypothetical protein